MNRFVIVVATLVASGCAVGPDYVAPDTDAATAFVSAEQMATSEPVADWWLAFDDTALTALIDAALADSPDLDAARARLDQARAVRGIARAAFWPTLAATGTYTNFEQSLESPGAFGQLVRAGLAERDGEFYTSTLETAWEIDVFGSVRRRNESAAASLGVAIADYRAAILGIVAETAAAYFEFGGAEQRIAALERNIELLRQTVELTENKQRSGLAGQIDVDRARAEFEAARAGLATLKAARDASRFRLGALTGQRPADIATTLVANPLPQPLPTLAVGTSADLLTRRPDVQAAERRLAAATADVGVATAEFFPRLTLAANYGFEAVKASDMGSSDARFTGIVPGLRLPIFEAGRLRRQRDGAVAGAELAAAAYESTVLTALSETETALSRYNGALQSSESLADAANAAGRAATTARKLYRSGLIDFLDVLAAERRQTELDDQAAAAQANALRATVDLYRSLGGGWQVAAN
ncbi:MAG: efflux transporter outer membrane subunit [Pseudomonadota bacterium]